MSAVPTVLKPVPRKQTPAPRAIVPQHQASVLRPNRMPLQLELQLFHRTP
jgi:hypothetical protein